MPSASADNVGGHRQKYEHLKANLPADQVGAQFVGGLDPVWVGYMEIEVIRRFAFTNGASIVDLGCGIGRLTQHVLLEPVSKYHGIDIIPEIMQSAEDMARGDDRFSFSIGSECKIPLEDATVDCVVGFSVITHLLDEEVFEYVSEARRVLRKGGVAVFSFLDFNHAPHRNDFFGHAAAHRHGHGDLLKFTTKDVLDHMAKKAGFLSVEFQDGDQKIPTSGLETELFGGDKIPESFVFGHSLCAMRV